MMRAVTAVEVLPGIGTVCRTGDAAMWLGHDVPPALASQLVDALGRAVGATDPTPALLAGVRQLVGGRDSRSLGAFAVVSPTATGVAAILNGPVLVQNERQEGYSGAGSAQVVDVEVPAEQIIVVWATADPASTRVAHPVGYDLRDGVVPGGGVAVRLAAARPPAPAPVPAAEPAPAVEPSPAPAP